MLVTQSLFRRNRDILVCCDTILFAGAQSRQRWPRPFWRIYINRQED
jgi:hypothetical protein